jgi:hypothetical protein
MEKNLKKYLLKNFSKEVAELILMIVEEMSMTS